MNGMLTYKEVMGLLGGWTSDQFIEMLNTMSFTQCSDMLTTGQPIGSESAGAIGYQGKAHPHQRRHGIALFLLMMATSMETRGDSVLLLCGRFWEDFLFRCRESSNALPANPEMWTSGSQPDPKKCFDEWNGLFTLSFVDGARVFKRPCLLHSHPEVCAKPRYGDDTGTKAASLRELLSDAPSTLCSIRIDLVKLRQIVNPTDRARSYRGVIGKQSLAAVAEHFRLCAMQRTAIHLAMTYDLEKLMEDTRVAEQCLVVKTLGGNQAVIGQPLWGILTERAAQEYLPIINFWRTVPDAAPAIIPMNGTSPTYRFPFLDHDQVDGKEWRLVGFIDLKICWYDEEGNYRWATVRVPVHLWC